MDKIFYNGVEYSSKVKCCEAFGFTYRSIYDYMCYHSLDFNTALDDFVNGKVQSPRLVYDGVKYKSKADCCKSLGLNYNTVLCYAQRNDLSFEKALNNYMNGNVNSSRVIEINGKTYDSINECCRDLGINISSVKDFKKRMDITTEEAIKLWTSNEFGNRRKFLFRDVVYESKVDCCKSFGIPYSRISKYMSAHSLDFKSALSKYIDNSGVKGDSVEYNGVLYCSKKDCCIDLNLPYAYVLSLQKKFSMSFEDVLDYVVSNHTYRGIYFRTRRELLEHYGINYCAFNQKLSRYKLNVFECLDYLLLCKKFDMPQIDNNGIDDLFNCKCKICGKDFVFTKDLAFRHIEECKEG